MSVVDVPCLAIRVPRPTLTLMLAVNRAVAVIEERNRIGTGEQEPAPGERV